MTTNSGSQPGRFKARVVLLTLTWLVTLAGAAMIGALAYKHRANIRSLIGTAPPADIRETNLYILRLTKMRIEGEGRDGSIDALGDGVLLVNRKGAAWFYDAQKQATPLKLRVPVNTSDFEADPHNQNAVGGDRFGVKDIFVQPTGAEVRILASYTYWHSDKQCYALRVSALETSMSRIMSGAGAAPADWTTVYETLPCRTLNKLRGGKIAVTLGAGGRIALLSDSEFLLSVGGFGAESESAESEQVEPAGDDSPYGKTVLVNLETGAARIYSRGHRNPEGLAVGSDSRVWLTEHGPKGGDELNLVLDGKDYGWPHVTYGTEYEMLTWPGNPQQGRHEGYEKPMYVWVPSIGVSQLMVVEHDAFPSWKGDLLVSSLVGMTIYRVRVEDNRAIFAEPIPIGHRIRDIAETELGDIVLKTDDDLLIYVERADAVAGTGEDARIARGQVLATRCQSCHTFEPGGENRIGPNLFGIVGRHVATGEGFKYSPALHDARLKLPKGRWSADALRKFLVDPQAFAPGTLMEMGTTYSDSELDDLVSYLTTLN